MSTTAVLLASLSVILWQQGGSPAEVRRKAESGPETELRAAVRSAPVASREALVQLLEGSSAATPGRAEGSLEAAERLAAAMAMELRDSFPLLEVERFRAWSRPDRERKLALDSLRRAGNAALGREGFPSALVAWRESARRAEQLHDSAGLAAALGNIGTGFYRAGRPDSAIAYFVRAHSLAWQAGDRRTALNALGAQANVLRDRGDLLGAHTLYLRATALRAEIGDVRGVVADQVNLGALAERMGDFAGARDAWTAALATSRRHSMPEPAAACLTNLARLATLEADFELAVARLDSALLLYHEIGDRSGAALVLHHLGTVELRRGDYPRAKARLAAAAAAYDSLGASPAAAKARLDLVAAHAAMGDLESASRQLDALAGAAHGAGVPPSALAAVSIARADLAVGYNDYASAEREYRTAESLLQGPGDARARADARQGLGFLLLLKGEPRSAAELLGQSAQEFQAAGDGRAAALARLDLAAAWATAGSSARAASAARAARDSLRAAGDPVGEAAALATLGDLALDDARPAAAAALHREGLALLAERDARTVAWRLHAGLGDALAAQRAPGPAAAAYGMALRLLEQSASLLPSEYRRTQFRADKWEVYGRLAELELARNRPAAAFDLSERMRAREFLDGLARGRVAWSAGADSALVRREQDLRHAVSMLSGRLAGANPGRSLRGPDPAVSSTGQAREALARAEAEYAALLGQLRDRQPAYARLVEGRPSSAAEVAAALPADVALLEYLVGESGTTLLVAVRGGIHAVALGRGRKELAALVEFARGALAREGDGGPAAAYRAPLQRLHEALVEPAESRGLLDGIRRIVFVPHRELHYLPFAALLERGRNGRYLIERFEVAVTPSASAWMALGRRASSRSAGRIVLLAPESGLLPGAEAEVRAIGRIMEGQADILSGAEASKHALRRVAGGAGIIHFATFGVLNRGNPLFSYVALAPGAGEDGRLEVHEVYGLSLDAALVVLSACQTALGSGGLADVPPGDDWIGLSQAFLSAGARRVVATLWAVEDRPTAEVMTWFYEGLAREEEVARALAGAQRRALKDPRLAHPYRWAGFSLVGGP